VRQFISMRGIYGAAPPAPWWERGLRWLTAMRDTPLKDGRDGAGNDLAPSPRAIPNTTDYFETFYRQHERDIFGYLWRVTGDEQTANDLTQEVFLRAWRQFEKLRGYERPEAWLFRVATNLALNERRRQRGAGPDATLLGDERAAGDHATQLATNAALRAALAGLPARQRAALILRELYGYSCDEIAGVLDVSRAAAKMTLSRARERLRALYLKEDGE
jgi:RNA polymerase sigma factor (sigma-70 family)